MNVRNRPVVDVESASVQGIAQNGVAAFRGIPDAASPVGNLRFAPPQRHPKWPGLRDASRPGTCWSAARVRPPTSCPP
ncbi:carboxylesterase family protein [Kutzneria buriramensis]|nr:carboxylesterase family protein [Kutzneria buriramensis]